jgi:Flp pilus assembly protein TadG
MIPICNPGRLRMLFARAAGRVAQIGSEEGTSLLEFAITGVVFFTVLTGAASFSLALYSMQQLSNATSSAIQSVSELRGITTDPCKAAVTSITGTLPNWTASKFTYTMWITDSTGKANKFGPTTGSGFSCTGGVTDQTENYPVTLTVSYAYSWIPILGLSPKSPLTATEGTMSY